MTARTIAYRPVFALLLAWCSRGRDAVYAVDRDGCTQPIHTCWKGFKRGTAVGLVSEKRVLGSDENLVIS